MLVIDYLCRQANLVGAIHESPLHVLCNPSCPVHPDYIVFAGQFPFIAHSPEGRDDCLACHGQNVMWPASPDHAGRTNNMCRGCHQPAQAQGSKPTP